MLIDSQIAPQSLDLLDLMQSENGEYQALFQSVTVDSTLGCYDFLFASDGFFSPSIEQIKNISIAHQQELAQKNPSQKSTQNISDKNNPPDITLPFIGGHLLFLPYEFNQSIHPKLVIKDGAANLKEGFHRAYLAKVTHGLIFCHQSKKVYFLAQNNQQLKRLKKQVQSIKKGQFQSPTKIKVAIQSDLSVNEQNYLNAVQQVKKHIQRGDVYQCNLSSEYQFDLLEANDSYDIFRALRIANPAPFSCLVHIDDFAIISSSPERLLQLKNGSISTRPIAGTIGRDKDPVKDQALFNQLLQSKKDQSEHIMLVDLERNDLSTIALDHSLQVSDRFVETYAYVHHLVSEIKVKIAPNIDLFDLISAVFPGGSITGCPKISCMEIIRNLEQSPRFAYTGSIGYIGENGQIDLNILIRTLFLADNRLSFRVGAGIVADSKPELELLEIQNKAIGMLKALDIDATIQSQFNPSQFLKHQ